MGWGLERGLQQVKNNYNEMKICAQQEELLPQQTNTDVLCH